MSLESQNGDRLNEVMLDFITTELVDERRLAAKRVLKKTQKEFPQIKPMVKAAQRFARLTDKPLDSDYLPKGAKKIKDKIFKTGRSSADLFTELVDITQELVKYHT